MASEALFSDGPCFTCEHARNHITHGHCPKFNQDVRAMNGCLDFSETEVHYQQAAWIDKLKTGLTGDHHAVQTPKRR
jgi:hypothetical protein